LSVYIELHSEQLHVSAVSVSLAVPAVLLFHCEVKVVTYLLWQINWWWQWWNINICWLIYLFIIIYVRNALYRVQLGQLESKVCRVFADHQVLADPRGRIQVLHQCCIGYLNCCVYFYCRCQFTACLASVLWHRSFNARIHGVQIKRHPFLSSITQSNNNAFDWKFQKM